MSALATILRDKAREYDLNALAHKGRGLTDSANGFTSVAITLHEIAEALEQAELEAEAA